jgi:hypothetical protein
MLFEMENDFVFDLMYHELIRNVRNSFGCLVHHVCHAVNQFDELWLGPLRHTVLYSVVISAIVSCITYDAVPNGSLSSVVD